MNRLTRIAAPLGLAAGLALASVPAAADWRPMEPQDMISLQLQAEDWVETGTARVVVSINAALDANQVGEARERIRQSLSALAEDADWHVVNFGRGQDSSGLEQWQVDAEARLPEGRLGGLREKARELSKPGHRVEIADIDFSPTLAEVEATEAEVRAGLYRAAQQELERVRALFPERNYRIHRIDLGVGPGPAPMPQMMKAERMATMSAPVMDAGGGAGFSVSRKVQMSAYVVLAAESERERGKPEGRKARE